jgi:amidase
MITDDLNAFASLDVHVPGAPDGPLSGMTFATKDIFDVAGHVTGGGNPDWQRTHGPAERNAPTVQALIEAGATLVGKTHTDELTRGIMGTNPHYGTPVNPAAPGRVPGGSSSGSASAVAGGVVDFALGSDTGGSVRMPASFCGLYGLRPTHGRISLDGVLPQAASFDTVGWFARDAVTFERVGRVLLQSTGQLNRPGRLVIAEDLFEGIDEDVRAALQPIVDTIAGMVGDQTTERVATGGNDEWMEHQRFLQMREAWDTQRVWIERTNPRVAFEVAIRYLNGMSVTDDQVAASNAVRQEVRSRVDGLLADGAIMCMPTSPAPAPPPDMPVPDRVELGYRIARLTCIGGMSGCPQINIPLATVDGLPVGLSLMGARGSDETLMRFAVEIEAEWRGRTGD